MKRKEILNALLIIAIIIFGLYYGLVANIPVPNALGCLFMSFMAFGLGLMSICISIRDKYFSKKTVEITE